MPERIQDVQNYVFSASDALFFDTNIWINIFWPSEPDSRRAKAYSEMWKRVLEAKANVFLDALVVSEFVNRCSRLDYQTQYADTFEDFKAFRSSQAFSTTAECIAITVRKWLRQCQIAKVGDNGLDLEEALSAFETGSLDFNDDLITQLCRKNELTLVTDDGDFSGKDVPILTANPKILRESRP